MQDPIMRNVALVAVGIATIAGKDVGRFWPDYEAFKFYDELFATLFAELNDANISVANSTCPAGASG